MMPGDKRTAARYGSAREPWIDDLAAYPTLWSAWKRSQGTCDLIKARLENTSLSRHVQTVAASGSLGRMEQIQGSDLDLIIVLRQDAGREENNAAYASVWDALHDVELPRPGGPSIFATAATHAELCDASDLGKVDEDMDLFGKRMQLLLDCQPLYGRAAYDQLLQEILCRYWVDLPTGDGSPWFFLLNDLIRYFRSLRGKAYWELPAGSVSLRLRHLKLLYSRRVMYTGLLGLLGEASCRAVRGLEWLLERLAATPLERIGLSLARTGGSLDAILQAYERFLATMNDPGFPTALRDETEEGRAQYAGLQDHGHRLARELFRGVLRQQDRWPEEFLVQLVF